jgi:methylated-DNA-protein-cysteine methyltransferase-like protein
LQGKGRSSKQQYLPRGLQQPPLYEKIYSVVRQIPPGKVATYGQIAKIVDRCTARMVGYAMAALSSSVDVPWQRVINYRGEISRRSHGDGSLRQRKLLEEERIRFDPKGRVDLEKVRWAGPDTKFISPQRTRSSQRTLR